MIIRVKQQNFDGSLTVNQGNFRTDDEASKTLIVSNTRAEINDGSMSTDGEYATCLLATLGSVVSIRGGELTALRDTSTTEDESFCKYMVVRALGYTFNCFWNGDMYHYFCMQD